MAEMTVSDAVQATLSSKEFQGDALKIASLAQKLASDPNASGYDAARLALTVADVATRLGGVAGELGEAIPMIGAMISVLEIASQQILAWQRGELAKKAAARDEHDWTIHPSGAGGALVAADLPAAFDGLLLAFGAGRTSGSGWVGGGRTLREGASKRVGLARDDMAGGATYLNSNRDKGLALVGSVADPVMPPLPGVRAGTSTLEFTFGGSVPVSKGLKRWEDPPPTEIETYLTRLGRLRRLQRLKNQAAGAAILQIQLVIAYGSALLLSANNADHSSWMHETAYMDRRARLASWLDSPLNSEPDGLQLRYGFLSPLMRGVTNARYGAVRASARENAQ